MSLSLSLAQRATKASYDKLIVSGPDAHGVSLAAARLLVLREADPSARILIVSKFPDTIPRNAAKTFQTLAAEVSSSGGTEILDIPVNVEDPAGFIRAAARLPDPVVVYDHHETSLPFVQEMLRHGIVPVTAGDGVGLAVALGVLRARSVEELERDPASFIAAVGIVADRDPSIVKVFPREYVEQRLLPLANKLDILVRNPRLLGVSTPADVAVALAEEPGRLESVDVAYPPAEIAERYMDRVRKGDIAIIVDMTDLDAKLSMWVPKTLEQLLVRTQRDFAVAVVPGYARTPAGFKLEGYDVRVLKYWLSEAHESAVDFARDAIEAAGVQGRVVGHESYVSIRFPDLETARRVAESVYGRIEGSVPRSAHLINDRYVAEAVRRDFKAIISEVRELRKRVERIEQALGVRGAPRYEYAH